MKYTNPISALVSYDQNNKKEFIQEKAESESNVQSEWVNYDIQHDFKFNNSVKISLFKKLLNPHDTQQLVPLKPKLRSLMLIMIKLSIKY